MAVVWKKLAYEDDVILKTLTSAKGDLIYASAANTPARLAIGGAGEVLQVSVDVPAWAAAPAPGAHAATHELGGADALNVGGLSGELADDQPPKAHAASHKDAGADEILLHEFGEPTGAVDFNGQQAQHLIVHTVANAAARPTAVIGKICWQTDTLAIYACTDDTP